MSPERKPPQEFVRASYARSNAWGIEQVPEALAKDHILSWSKEGDLVYDCFMGSGTTAKMAMLNKRKFIGSEISK